MAGWTICEKMSCSDSTHSVIVSCSIAAIFGSAATSASNKPQSGGFTFGATTATTLPSGGSETAAAPSTFAFGGAASTAGTDTGFAFRKRTNEGDDAPVKRSKGVVVLALHALHRVLFSGIRKTFAGLLIIDIQSKSWEQHKTDIFNVLYCSIYKTINLLLTV